MSVLEERDYSSGWVAPGHYLRSFFDLPEDFLTVTREENAAEAEGKEASGQTDSRGEI